LPDALRRYDLLFKSENPNEHEDWIADLDPRSLEVGCCRWLQLRRPSSPPSQVVRDAVIEQSLASAPVGSRFQFERVA
jgi:hypothetical protein